MNDMIVVAHNANEMAQAQSEIAAWADRKGAEALAMREEINESLAVAQKNRWATKGLKTGLRLAQMRHEFYRKIATASRLGYVIVPNLPIDVVAIRTDKFSPRRGQQFGWSDHQQKSEGPPEGEGRYVSPTPEVLTDVDVQTNDAGKEVSRRFSWAEEFRDVEFPVRGVKPLVLDDAGRAMALKVFDEIGIAPQGAIRRRNFDPMLIGRIVYRRGATDHNVSFLIAWWMSNRDLEIPQR